MKIDIWRIDGASLLHSESRIDLSSEYLQAREKIWMEQKQLCGSRLWNGTVYTIDRLDNFDNIVIHLGQCEYKDIMIKEKCGSAQIAAKYGNNCIAQHLIICIIPITSDGFFVLPIVGDGTIQKSGLIDLFGGTANQDEVAVTTFQDLSQFALHELKEEAGWSESYGKLKPWLLTSYDYKYAMLFQFRLCVSSAEIQATLAKSEVSSISLVKPQELSEIASNRCSAEAQLFIQIIKDRKYEL